ncbi:hypothetical protein INR49_007008 [Caranx melampygus]|nr:hypothetical protein INR49_007008 [Caranx melampygus]
MMSNPGFRGCRTISQHLNDLKKENFSLKLRIYFLEERSSRSSRRAAMMCTGGTRFLFRLRARPELRFLHGAR